MEGVVIEGQVEAGLGKTATVLLSRGTLRPSQYLVCGKNWAKVRWIQNPDTRISMEIAG